MIAVLQRVSKASVSVDGAVVGKCQKGLAILLGVAEGDSEKDATVLAEKISKLRIFTDENDKMNLSLEDVSGEILVVSQFTLYGDCKKGRRPNFTGAGKPDFAEKMYEEFVKYLKTKIEVVETGSFGADMQVLLENDGPVTLIIDSKE